jgi:dTMP kinase
MPERGIRVVFEGGDGVGKSTIMQMLAERNRRERGVRTFTLEEPDSIRDETGKALVPIAEELRTIIKSKKYRRSALSNVHLFNTSRHENLLQGIEPALAAGIDVYCARDWDSTNAYQGFGQGWDLDEIRRMVVEATSEDYMNPDFKFYLDLPEDMRLQRLAARDDKAALDTFESMQDDFHLRVAEGYRTLARMNNRPLISALPSREEIADEIWQHMYGKAA